MVSGISRSGTSLLSVLLNTVSDVVCFNEVMPTDPDRLPEALARARRDLLTGRPVKNKFDSQGELTTDTLGDMVIRKAVVKKPLTREMTVATKRNIPYLNEAERLLGLGYSMVAMIRDPVYTLGSWGSPKATAAKIPGATLSPDATHPHWHKVSFTKEDVVERRAEAWQHFASRIWDLRDRLLVVTYERLCAEPERTMAALCSFAGLAPPGPLPDLVRPAQNDARRYRGLRRIRAAVHLLCPARELFGYR